MVQRIGGFRRKTRHKLKKHYRQKGKISLSKYFQSFKQGDKVILKAEPAVQKGLYQPKFHGLHGIIKGKQGRCYEIIINDQDKKKTIIAHPVHLKKVLRNWKFLAPPKFSKKILIGINIVKPTLVEEKTVTLAEVKKNLAEIRKRDGELNFRANKAEEYLNDLDILSPEKAQELQKKLEGLKISRLKEDQITKIIDLLPTSVEDLKIILQGYTVSISKKDMEQVISVVKSYQ